MNMQGTAGQGYKTRGASYTADPVSGIVLNVANGDVHDMLQSGCTPILPTGRAMILDLLNVKNSDGSALAAAASAGKFGFTVTGGSAFCLIGEVATSNTKTDTAIIDFRLPDSYVAGSNLSVGVNCVEKGGAATVKTLGLNAYKLDQAGGESADLDTTAAQSMGTVAGTLTYVVTGATLNPGDIVQLKLTSIVTEAAAGAVHSEINAITVT